MKKWIVTMLIIAVAAFGSVIGFNYFVKGKIADAIANLPEAEFPVTTQTIELTNWQPVISAIGFVEPLQGVTLANELSGTVASIEFENGSKVEKGQILLQLNTQVEKANLTSKQVQLPAAEADYKRLLKLYRQKSVSKQDLDNAEAKYLALKADITSLKATIERKIIRAPFSGLIGISDIHLGQFLQAGTEIVRLENITTMKIRFTVTQTQLPKIALGQDISVFVDAYPEKPFSGKISAIEPAVFYQSGLIQVQAEIPNHQAMLRSGMFSKVNVQLPMLTNQMVLPQTAINFSLYGNTVYFVAATQENGKTIHRVKQNNVNVLARKGSQVLISGGVKKGDRIVTTGQIRLSNHSKVKIVDDKTITPPATLPKL
ncbi:efflux RND transporter periplasmic adaptor subunit [Parashewanella spongiae]|uniref:Efflux RND transporter periplasmic adaptor subunit n=1 Tax=Parashewanella spongiae TaxID=342950 RepID=A0A3A6TQ23_9GAMM|nr:efflux RND transporter periplasmic adaptor subunit [Parashewanella spongiae]MCL1078529.1 efflux RND transporter periplasmic adaptor subunit [Parashewanella spongiae]RJY13453.1 efflux RND transporter periplasmic adaptor subunit [Parashewanella spongiae]